MKVLYLKVLRTIDVSYSILIERKDYNLNKEKIEKWINEFDNWEDYYLTLKKVRLIDGCPIEDYEKVYRDVVMLHGEWEEILKEIEDIRLMLEII